MEKTAIAQSEEFDSHANTSEAPSALASPRFERPSIEEISLCCEISAYAPDDDDRPLF